jgi:hypothetical protein
MTGSASSNLTLCLSLGINQDAHKFHLFLSSKVKSFSDIEVINHHTRKENIQDKLTIKCSKNINYSPDIEKYIFLKI